MIKLLKSRLFLLTLIIVAVILALFTAIFLQHEAKNTSYIKNPVTNDSLVFFKSDIFDISFYYPTNFFVFEDGNTINVSPFKKDNGGFQKSSTGIASNLTITLRKNEPFLNNVILTQNYDSREFSEEKTTYKGLETFTQSYRGEYADEMNYIRLVNYKNISPGKSDLLYIHYTEVNKDAYEKILDSVTFGSN